MQVNISEQGYESVPIPEGAMLFVSAHPDDESMSFGALIDRQTDLDPASVTVMTATLGEGSTVGDQDHVVSGGRLDEAEKAYDIWGVPSRHEGNRVYLNLPDTELYKRRNIIKLAWHIGKVGLRRNISTFVSPGEDGFDGHSDHVAVHTATVLAAKGLRLFGRRVNVLGIHAEGQGETVVDVDRDKKVEALQQHGSQFMDELDQIIERQPSYGLLMKQETYDNKGTNRDLRKAVHTLIFGTIQRNIPQ